MLGRCMVCVWIIKCAQKMYDLRPAQAWKAVDLTSKLDKAHCRRAHNFHQSTSLHSFRWTGCPEQARLYKDLAGSWVTYLRGNCWKMKKSKHFRQFQKIVPLNFPGYQKTCRCIGTECQRSPRSIRWRKSLHKFHRSAFDGNCEYTWASIQSLS